MVILSHFDLWSVNERRKKVINYFKKRKRTRKRIDTQTHTHTHTQHTEEEKQNTTGNNNVSQKEGGMRLYDCTCTPSLTTALQKNNIQVLQRRTIIQIILSRKSFNVYNRLYMKLASI